MPKHWKVTGAQANGERIVAVCETHDLKNQHDALLFGAGQLRGMGFAVTDARAERVQPKPTDP